MPEPRMTAQYDQAMAAGREIVKSLVDAHRQVTETEDPDTATAMIIVAAAERPKQMVAGLLGIAIRRLAAAPDQAMLMELIDRYAVHAAAAAGASTVSAYRRMRETRAEIKALLSGDPGA